MSNRAQRRAKSPLPPRPQLITEQLRDQINANLGNRKRVMNRQECTELTVMLAANLERLLNNNEQLPWVTASIDKRANGFSIDVRVIEPTEQNDAWMP